jgi:poly(3-hydroxybutyrate) depolymerase
MPVLTDQLVPQATDRVYHISVPDNPAQDVAPAIVVFHGGGQDAATIARRWGIEPGSPVPANVADYLLVFPEADGRLGDEWVHFKHADSAFPTLDLEFVDLLLQTLIDTDYTTQSATVPTVSADPGLVYAAGFSNGAGMVWQLLNSNLVSRFQGFAAVAQALDPEKAQHYQRQLGQGVRPPAVPVMYVHGTTDRTFRPPATLQEVPLDMTHPGFTVREMLARNNIPADAPAVTSLVPGSGNLTEVVVQAFQPPAGGGAAFTYATVINGGHNWPGPTTVGNRPVASHFDATQAILDFWHTNAGLP